METFNDGFFSENFCYDFSNALDNTSFLSKGIGLVNACLTF